MEENSNSQQHSSLERIYHKRSDLHMLRKIWHVSTGGFALWCYYQFPQSQNFWAILALIVGVLGFTFDYWRMKSESVNKVIIKFMGPLMRKSEKQNFSGLPYYALGISLALFFYSKEIALLSIFYLVISDPVSSFFGVLYGKDKILPNKSLQGAVAGFLTCYMITLLMLTQNAVMSVDVIIFSIVGGIIGSLSELISAMNIDDNLTIPVLSGLGLTILNYLIPLL